MAIHQDWAEAIMDGSKRVEFRKRRLADDIETVLVYATAPVSKIVGHFMIDEIVSSTPADIWARFGNVGAIGRDAFFTYFNGKSSAVAILVASAQRFEDPLELNDIYPKPGIPQSFSYLPSTTPALAAVV
ncbi:ASCH domain-containing protein [Cryobacterium sp. TMS1-20-1]|uniref:ASCH domain-containing protein n=1 Tax=Cryobacterium sp. TMS1-20-1 TaxID=1259223 RepID=UPI00141B91E8|nr:ASCH domain-containing protein [Cryobacterium sp. TMS1-20-1]